MTGLMLTRVVRDVRKGREQKMTERKPHKWAEVIKAWADGKPIQVRMDSCWVDYDSNNTPPFNFACYEFRVKPENIIFEECVFPVKWIIQHKEEYKLGRFDGSIKGEPNLRLEFDPDTRKLVKAEVIR